MKFTKEEISLCKQVAEKHRKEIERREYLYNTFSKRVQWSGERGQTKTTWAIPLWTISDCLEFLREREIRYDLEDYRVTRNESVLFIISGGKEQYCRLNFKGKSPLEACLKAVLAVLEDK